MDIKIARVDASVKIVTPTYATPGSAGVDLVATSKRWVERTWNSEKNRYIGGYYQYGTNIATEIPVGFYAKLEPKSSIRDYSLILTNEPNGTIDSDYRGEIMVCFRKDSTHGEVYSSQYQVGDQIGQLVLHKREEARYNEVTFTELSQTERGTGGHGSTSDKQDYPLDARTTEDLTEDLTKDLPPAKLDAAMAGLELAENNTGKLVSDAAAQDDAAAEPTTLGIDLSTVIIPATEPVAEPTAKPAAKTSVKAQVEAQADVSEAQDPA